MRSSLLSAVSHDLRTPLAAITGAATALRDERRRATPAAQRELLDTIVEEAERLERLLANLLDMTRLETGGVEPKREWVPLEELVGAALTRLESAARRVARCSVDLPDDLPLRVGRPGAVRAGALNLLENAAKYTPPGSPIEIAARRATATRRGRGRRSRRRASRRQRGAVFEKFYRGAHAGAPAASASASPICRGIVEAHGGTHRRGEPRRAAGALFRLALPLDASAPEPRGPHRRDRAQPA